MNFQQLLEKYGVFIKTSLTAFILASLLTSCHVKRATDPVNTESPTLPVPEATPSVKMKTALKKTPLPGAYNTRKLVKLLKGKKVGLVVNHTSMIGEKHLIDTLLALHIDIVKVFAPEHGFSGLMEAGGIVSDSALNGSKPLSVVSLYGSKKQPSAEDLDSLDVLVFDIQDVGVRFYTYISTLHYVMESCAEYGKPLIVIDRPNPNGHYVDGFVLDPAFRSFIGMHPIPVVHGLTIGELAGMINGERWLKDGKQIDLKIVRNLFYKHKSHYEPPVPPSPNLKDFRAITLYPSTCFFEGTVISEGRGTDKAFVQFGHPDLKNLPHVFTPRSISSSLQPKHLDAACFGYDLSDLPLQEFREKGQLNLGWLLELYQLFPDKTSFFLSNNFIDKLAGTDRLRKMILDGKSEEEIRINWKQELDVYKKTRKKYLLYADFE